MAQALHCLSEGAETAWTQWRTLRRTAGAEGELPALLRLPLQQTRKMVRLEVVSTHGAALYDAEPSPGSAVRRKARHLRRSPNIRADELPAPSPHRDPLPRGFILPAVRHSDFSYGEGEVKGATDPIISVYQVYIINNLEMHATHQGRD